MKFRMNRRQLLTLSASGAGVLFAAGAGLSFFSPESFGLTHAAAPILNPFPFDMPSTATLRASKKKAFAYYFPPYPVSIENVVPSQDYYARWLDPDAKNGEYRSIGGYLRDRPLGRAPRAESSWLQTDYKIEVQRAIDIGLDGFIYEMPDHTSVDQRWNRINLMLDAAKAVDPGFRVGLSIDFPTAADSTPNNMANTILALKNHPSLLRLDDGRIVVAPFYPERKPLDWWKQLRTLVQAGGADIAFIPLFLSTNVSSYQSWMSFTYGVSSWGTRKASGMGSYTTDASLAHSHNNIWVAPIATQDTRPKEGNYWEGSNSQLLRNSWTSAIQTNAEWALMLTWNDYSESTQFAPSVETQYAFYDLTAYYTAWFKTGVQPAITRDVLYYFHRTQFANAQPDTTKQTKVMTLRAASDPAIDKIELLGFLKSSGTLEVSVAGNIYQQQANAGMTSFTAPLAAGIPSFRLTRSSASVISMPSAFPIASSITYQDLMYHSGGSSRAPIMTRRYFKLVNHNSGQVLDDTNGGGAGTALLQQTSNGATKQQWILVPGPDGYYQIQCKANNLVIDMPSTSQSAFATLATPSSTSDSQLWQITPTGDGYCVFTNKKSGYALDVRGASQTAGANVIQYAYHQGANQQWQLQVV
ncbi:endo-1,3-alpha-glucanase family glycosylhydrolase [Ktedonospora formicarum]|uniref:Ricin B lectin domain-containing protein n=1 Tax=Ktedonospora formicarum TaxID=2778364 RepID=A0A8J3HYF5_9CHLR|nr:endo-1,3-alpha-glucanase family glycosylhydrolase [Ktedonospora formicarum]GHO46517.1 hypothetical protein KSX_46800 [Ktedonospora formicarum]